MPRRKLTRGMLLTVGNEKILEKVMMSPKEELFGNMFKNYKTKGGFLLCIFI